MVDLKPVTTICYKAPYPWALASNQARRKRVQKRIDARFGWRRIWKSQTRRTLYIDNPDGFLPSTRGVRWASKEELALFTADDVLLRQITVGSGRVALAFQMCANGDDYDIDVVCGGYWRVLIQTHPYSSRKYWRCYSHADAKEKCQDAVADIICAHLEVRS